MKAIIAGSRTVTALALVAEAIEASGFVITEVVSGGAPGVDSLAERWAEQHGILIAGFPADWNDMAGRPGR